MKLDKFVAVSGLPGIHKLLSSRSNGIFIYDCVENRSRFIPARAGNITPLATISMYTETEEGLIGLNEVFVRVKNNLATNPLPDAAANSETFRTWFSAVIEEHDRDRVHITDIKKLVKWYKFMSEKGLIAEAEKAADEADEAEKEKSKEDV